MLRKYAPLTLAALVLGIGCADGSQGPTGPDPASIKPSRDDVGNNLDASLDAVAEVMPLNVGGANGTTQLYVTPRNGDGKNGCNLTGGTTLVVSISSSNPSVATVSPSSATFTACSDAPTLTITPVSQGSATISLTQTSNNTGATFALQHAAFTVNVAPPANTAPQVSILDVTGGVSYNKGSVPAATCQVTDAEDGNSSFPATLSAITGPHAGDGIGSQEATCTYTDGGGLSAGASVIYSIIDPSAPDVDYVIDGTLGSNGWYTSDVSLTWTVAEPESPNSLAKTGCVDQSITDDQAEQTYACSATSAGGSAGPVEVKIKRDATAPSVSLVGGPADGGVYYFGNVPAAPTCSASDATSGLDGNCTVNGYSAAIGTHTVKAAATDKAGNVSETQRSYMVKAWTLSGFYSPVDMGGVVNTVKGGSTVPLKLEVFAGVTELTATSAIASFKTGTVNCSAVEGAPSDEIEITSTGGTSLRYDATAGQFIQNWQTPKNPGFCYKVTLTTQDGSVISALFKLK